MQDSEIYTKTEAGRDEIRTRALKLSMAMRAILLMVDGHRTVSDLRTIIAGSKAPGDTLDTLLAQGLIATTAAAAAAAAPAAPAPLRFEAQPPVAQIAPASARFEQPNPQESARGIQPPAVFAPLAPGAPVDFEIDPLPGAASPDPRSRYDQLYTMMNEIVRDFLPAHRRYFIQLKIERCGTAEELLEVLHDLRLALTKSRGEAFATDVVARLRNGVG